MWIEQEGQSLRSMGGTREITPDRFRTFQLDTQRMQDLLRQLPQENDLKLSQSPAIMEVPLPDGRVESFRVVTYEMVEPALAARYPDYYTVRGISAENPGRRLRMDWTRRGFRGMITGPEGRIFIDPVFRENKTWYQSYRKSDFRETEPFTCGFESLPEKRTHKSVTRSGDCVFRSYRLVVATTGEYSNYFGAMSNADESIVYSEVMTAVNRVNDVYEADIAVRMILVEETVDIFFYNGNTDPYTNGNGSAMLGQNIATCNDIIGSANYDIGHVFSTGGGGVAYLGVPCGSNKAGGVTGQNNPVNDPFYIDYVAHEIGHQFGANHTQNNSCNRNNPTAMEPGSASTIMGYAGICNPNVQPNSDAYFHGISVQEMNNYITNGNGNSCDVPLSFTNNAPSVLPQGNYTIPISTPFMLTADAIDTDGDPLFYCWEQWDPEAAPMPPQSTNTAGPMFRTFFPEPSPTRYFPRLLDLVSNTDFDWEELPSVSRDMEFRVTIRDDVNGVGCTTEDNLIVTTNASAGPFVVTSPGSSVTWMELENVTIEWNVANTDQGPVSCSSVDILLSRDGGFTYPDTLALGVSNDGMHQVTVPEGVTNQGRIMVRCSDNIFFDISDDNITIEVGLPGYSLFAAIGEQTICDEDMTAFSVQVNSTGGYTDPVFLSLSNPPPGSVVSIAPSPVIPGNLATIRLSNLNASPTGWYEMELQATSTSGNASLPLILSKPGTPDTTELLFPANGETNIPGNLQLLWQAEPASTDYMLEIADHPDLVGASSYANIVDTLFQLPEVLQPLTTYFWRVRGINTCGNGPWSEIFSFTTRPCFIIQSTDTPIPITTNALDTINSILFQPHAGTIEDVNIDLEISHTWINDLRIKLTSPGQQSIYMLDQICSFQNNMDLLLDDEAPNNTYPCPPVDGMAYQPEEPLSILDGGNAQGNWVLSVEDVYPEDGGALENWKLEICINQSCQLNVSTLFGTGAGSLFQAMTCAANGDTIVFDPQLMGDTIIMDGTMLVEKEIYLINENAVPVYITTNLPVRIFEIANSWSLGLENIALIGKGQTEGSALLNEGTLKLQAASVKRFGSSGIPVIKNSGVLEVSGNCTIEK